MTAVQFQRSECRGDTRNEAHTLGAEIPAELTEEADIAPIEILGTDCTVSVFVEQSPAGIVRVAHAAKPENRRIGLNPVEECRQRRSSRRSVRKKQELGERGIDFCALIRCCGQKERVVIAAPQILKVDLGFCAQREGQVGADVENIVRNIGVHLAAGVGKCPQPEKTGVLGDARGYRFRIVDVELPPFPAFPQADAVDQLAG